MRTLEKPSFYTPFNLDRVMSSRSTRRLSRAGVNIALGCPGSPLFALPVAKPNVIVYAEFTERTALQDIIGDRPRDIAYHLGELAHRNKESALGPDEMTSDEYIHAFVWRDRRDVMTDVWRAQVDQTGYRMTTIEVFRNYDRMDPEKYGHTGRNVLFVMGREVEFIETELDDGALLSGALKRTADHMPIFPGSFIVDRPGSSI